ncbi:hypothetical protein Pla108_21660 [Botrimarina colliarenosi]|uniref:PilZ domain protein n=1 Tax=Botrimarina colliarenosi TaxID=2528001 RepID=A0A5C6AG20_9BACT|nr:PilZ domain-containing protein [Botrimarina colliarenosi]TWT98011.1 hypothetical protein Pla108_21660 [Botrimarina colliarenosi]
MINELAMLEASLDELDFLCQIGRVPRSPSAVDRSDLISVCDGCDRDLHWPTPRAGRLAAPAPCPQCGRCYFTEVDSVVTIESANPFWTAIPAAPKADGVNAKGDAKPIGGDVLAKLFGADCVIDERRQLARYAMSAPVVGVPLDRKGRPIDEAIALTVLNVSAGGVGLMSTHEYDGELLAIDFSPAGFPGVQAIGVVRWRQPLHGVTKFGCEFLRPWTLRKDSGPSPE